MPSKSGGRKKVTQPKRLYLNKPAENALARFMLRFQAPSQSEAARRVLEELDSVYQVLEDGGTVCGMFPDSSKDRVLFIPRS